MLKAKDIMTTDVITLSPDTDIQKAARLLLEKNINGVPVVEGDKLVGVLSQTDLVAQQKELSIPSLFTLLDGFIPLKSFDNLEAEMQKISAMDVRHAMTRKLVTVEPDTPLDRLAAIMVDKKLHTIPVLDGDRLVGVIGRVDVLRTLMEQSR